MAGLHSCKAIHGNFFLFSFFFNDTAPTELYTLSLHDALPISASSKASTTRRRPSLWNFDNAERSAPRSEEHTSELQSHVNLVCRLLLEKKKKKKKHQIIAIKKKKKKK